MSARPTFYRGCIMPDRSERHHGLFTAYVQFSSSDGTFVRADSIPGLRNVITRTLADHGMKSAHRY